VYALMVDEITDRRHEARMQLNEVLERPLDPDEAEEWDRDRWGMTGAALQEQARQEDWLDEFTVG